MVLFLLCFLAHMFTSPCVYGLCSEKSDMASPFLFPMAAKTKRDLGRFGSLTTTLAATLGTGNIIGISTAVFLGGPGAVFWCWLTGLLGMATTYAETFLCHHFRYQGHGGPMYILHFLLHKKTLALLYSAALTLSAFFIGCTTQSNAITETCHQVFSLPPATCAIITAFFVGLILMQGRKWIENVSIAIVPTMAIFFFGGCLLYLILHADYLLPSLKLIFSSAFALPSIGGGFAGYTMAKAIRYGVARGLFTNESGLGTTGLLPATAQKMIPSNRPPFPVSYLLGHRRSLRHHRTCTCLLSVGISVRMADASRLRLNDRRIWKTSIFR